MGVAEKAEMVVCKCRRATKQYCFVHKVGVCAQCVVEGDHNCCVVKTYAEWVVDGDYAWPPACGFCRAPLVSGEGPGGEEKEVGGENVRFGCKHVVHTGCLETYLENSPDAAVASDFQCPSCSTPVWPPPLDVYPEGSKFSERLKEVLMRNPGKAERMGVVSGGAAGGSLGPLASPHMGIDMGMSSPVIRGAGGGGASGRFPGGLGRQPNFLEGEKEKDGDDDGGKGRGKSLVSFAPLFVQQMVGSAGREFRLPVLDPMLEGLAGKPLGSTRRRGKRVSLVTAVIGVGIVLMVLMATATVLLGKADVHPHVQPQPGGHTKMDKGIGGKGGPHHEGHGGHPRREGKEGPHKPGKDRHGRGDGVLGNEDVLENEGHDEDEELGGFQGRLLSHMDHPGHEGQLGQQGGLADERHSGHEPHHVGREVHLGREGQLGHEGGLADERHSGHEGHLFDREGQLGYQGHLDFRKRPDGGGEKAAEST